MQDGNVGVQDATTFFKSFPVQTDEHFLTVARYVERNALRAKLVTGAEDW